MSKKRVVKHIPKRYDEIKVMLEQKREELQREIQSRVHQISREGREVEKPRIDSGNGEVSIQEEIELSLVQMKAETLSKLETALRRLDGGLYGKCCECNQDISEARLQALPFAVRCRKCEEERQVAKQRAKRNVSQRAF